MSVSDDIWQRIKQIRSLEGLGVKVAPDVAVVIEADLRRSIQEGATPDGVKWKPTQEGNAPLQHAAKALYVAAVGGKVFVRIKGPEARHHAGTARGRIKRQVIPSGATVPARMAAEIRAVLDRAFTEAMTNG